MIATFVRVAVVISLATAAGCGNSSSHAIDASPTGDAARAPLDAKHELDAPRFLDAPTGSSLRLAVPSTYTGAPRELAVIGAKQVPVNGPPDSVFLLDMMPVPVAGQTLNLSLDTSTASGAMYVVVVLYQQGGGQFSPKSGVDYVAQSAATFDFTGASLDLGTLNLVLAP